MKFRIQVYKTTRMAVLEIEGETEGEAMTVALKKAVRGKATFGDTDSPFLAVASPAEKPMWELGKQYPATSVIAIE